MQGTDKNRILFDASHLKVGIVVSRFNKEITDKLLNAALVALKEYRVKEKNIKTIFVAGSMEIPYALQVLAKTKKYDCLVALGCVIRGETPHFDYVCKTAQEGVLKVILKFSIPIGFGVIMVNNFKQAKERFHVGTEALAAALESAKLWLIHLKQQKQIKRAHADVLSIKEKYKTTYQNAAYILAAGRVIEKMN